MNAPNLDSILPEWAEYFATAGAKIIGELDAIQSQGSGPNTSTSRLQKARGIAVTVVDIALLMKEQSADVLIDGSGTDELATAWGDGRPPKDRDCAWGPPSLPRIGASRYSSVLMDMDRVPIADLTADEIARELEAVLSRKNSIQGYLDNTTKAYKKCRQMRGADAHKRSWRLKEQMERYQAQVNELDEKIAALQAEKEVRDLPAAD